MKTMTRESYSRRIEKALDYLSGHLGGTLDFHRLADEACLSPYHFHRIYVAMMGETVAETIRRKRLHAAAIMLVSSARTIAGIAQDAGYASVPAFTRAFGEAYGLPPAKYRLHGQLSAQLQRSRQFDRKEHSMKYQFTLGDVRVQTLPAVRVAALQHEGDYHQIGNAFDRLAAWSAGKGFLAADTPSFGIYYDDPASKPKTELRSEACIEAPASVQGEGEIRMLATPGGKCAVLEFKGPYSDLEEPYRWLYDTWLPQSGEEPRDAPPYEAYLNDARSTPPTELRTAICIPLR